MLMSQNCLVWSMVLLSLHHGLISCLHHGLVTHTLVCCVYLECSVQLSWIGFVLRPFCFCCGDALILLNCMNLYHLGRYSGKCGQRAKVHHGDWIVYIPPWGGSRGGVWGGSWWNCQGGALFGVRTFLCSI